MKLELYLQNSNDGTVYDISDLAEEIQVKQSLDSNAGQLTCTLQKDPNNILRIANGSIISFIVNNTGFFFGYVFKIGTDANATYKITAYDQLRYLKNSDVYVTSNMTASNIFAKICNDFKLNYEIKVPSNYVPEPHLHDGQTLYAIIKRGIDLANIAEKAQYFILDRFGKLVWSELSYEKTNVQIGEGSMLTSYTYEKSIDSNTYNQVKFYRDNKESGKRDVWLVKDSDNIKRWGILQFLKKADEKTNAGQIKEAAQNNLTVKNKETETLKLTAEGILELTAGKGIKVVIDREGIDKWMWIKSSTHTFTKDTHTMDLEVDI